MTPSAGASGLRWGAPWGLALLATVLLGWLWRLELLPLCALLAAGMGLNLLALGACKWPWEGARRPVQRLELAQLERQVRRHPQRFWMGYGVHWNRTLAQTLHQRLSTSGDSASTLHLLDFSWRRQHLHLAAAPRLEHLLVVGAPGTGKTQLFKLLALQALLRREAVILLDPKGGEGLRPVLAQAARQFQRPYFQLLPAQPKASHALDLLANGLEASELASRLCFLLPQGEEDNVFGQFAWLTLQRIFQALLLLQRPLSFAEVRQHVADQGRTLYTQLARCSTSAPDLGTALEGLRTLCAHESGHYQKMILALTPVLQQLSTGVMATLLRSSQEPPEGDAPGAVFNLEQITRQGGVFYAGLEALSDATRARALGALILSDLAALVGNRYRTGVTDAPPLRLFVDEASETCNPAFIQLLNKGREAGISVTFAVQTLADLEVALGSAEAARMMIGNAGHFLAFRTLDAPSRQLWSERAGSGWIPLTQHSLGAQESRGWTGARRALSAGRAQALQQLPLIPEVMLAQLPDLHYVLLQADGSIQAGCLPLIRDPRQPERT